MSEKNYLENYRKEDYEKLSLTVDILIFTIDHKFNLQILLKKRKNYPYKDYWAIPGSFVGIDESLEEAVKRVMKEKTGLQNIYKEQLYTFGKKDRDPRMRIVSVSYLAFIKRNSVYDLSDDLAFFPINQKALDDLNLAFDHKEIIALSLERMKGKLSYTDIALELLCDKNKFTLYELQKIYEAIDEKEYDVSNFRRYFKKRYEEEKTAFKTNELCREFSKRPSSYYKIIDGR